MFDMVDRILQIRFVGARRGTSNINTGCGTTLAQHNGASGRAPSFGEMS